MADAQASIAALRLTLATTRLGQRSAEKSRPLAHLFDATTQVVHARTACDFPLLGALLPGLISELHTAVVQSQGEERQAALESLFVVFNSAMTLAHAHEYQMEAWTAAQRAQQVADEIAQPAWQAMAAFTVVHALLPMGGHAAAYEVASSATDRARSLEGLLRGRDRAEAAYGSLLLASALTASITGRTEESADRLVEASTVAERTGEGSPLVATFGPTNVSIYSMASALEHGAAVSLARSVELSHIPSQERRAKFHMDLVRAFHGTGDHENAITAYRHAEVEARGRVYGSVYARETVAALRDQLPRDTESGRQARSLAYRMGLN